MRDLGKELLEEEGYQVIAAYDGVEALEIYKQRHADIALVVLDLVMPRMDGGQTFIEMKKINPSLKAFFCTGYALDKAIAALIKEEHLRALQKPFQPGQLLKMVADVLEM
jgi:CheY-like chemotaxis protein